MQLSRTLAFALCALVAHLASVEAARLQGGSSPLMKVLDLLRQLKAGVESDGLKQQQIYDKSACWCEKTLERKAKAIAEAKESIEKLQTRIIELKGELAVHEVEITQLKKDIAANRKAQKEAEEVRAKENDEYMGEKVESEQCIGALEAATKILTGAGSGKKGFLQQEQLVSVAAEVRMVLNRGPVARSTSEQDLQTVQRFVERPADFLGASGLSAAQVGANPFGDYAPQSSQIQGILKAMYDAMTSDLEKANAEEGSQQKAFEELMETKKKELTTLVATLETHEADEARKGKELSESRTGLDDTKEQLEADEVFFEATKESCKEKALAWAQVSALRTEELQGINKALEILEDPQAQKTFAKSAQTFLQLRSSSVASRAVARAKALQALARSAALARITAVLKAGGHFDKVMAMIDEMVQLVRKEEADDIAHRDRCQGDTSKNANDLEDLAHAKKKAADELSRTQDEARERQTEVDELDKAVAETEEEMKAALEIRNGEHDEFKSALKEDTDAVELIQKAIEALSKFYKDNNIELAGVSLVQQPEEYTVDEDQAPEAVDADYTGSRKGESTNIISTLSMIVEDMQKEMKESKKDDADSQKAYVKDRQAMRDTLEAQEKSKAAAETVQAELSEKAADGKALVADTQADIEEAEAMKETLETDCAWLTTHFDSRRQKRKAELQGLQEAKSALAGAEQGDFDEVTMMEGSP